jgi:hypothetical protein
MNKVYELEELLQYMEQGGTLRSFPESWTKTK